MRGVALLALGVGCVPDAVPTVPASLNAPPEILAVNVACEGDGENEQWVYAAEVVDPDGTDDIYDVTVFVYDEVTEEPQASTQLDRGDGDWWNAQVPAQGSGLDCTYLRYSADFVAVDAAGDSDAITAFVKAEIVN